MISERVDFEVVDVLDVPAEMKKSIDRMGPTDSWIIKAMALGATGVAGDLIDAVKYRPSGLLLPDDWSRRGVDAGELIDAMDIVRGAEGGFAEFQNPRWPLFPETVLRDHRKFEKFGNDSYTGPMNFDIETFDSTYDFLLKTSNPAFGDAMAEILDPRSEKYLGHRENLTLQIDPSKWMIFEGLSPFTSPIMRQARRIGRAAVDGSLVYVSQMRPSGLLERSVFSGKKQARPPIYNHPSSHDRMSFRMTERLQSVLPLVAGRAELDHKKRVHAKVIIAIVEDFLLPDNTRYSGEIALVGSHNYTHSGIFAGTQEMAMLITDDQLVEQLREWVEKTFPDERQHRISCYN